MSEFRTKRDLHIHPSCNQPVRRFQLTMNRLFTVIALAVGLTTCSRAAVSERLVHVVEQLRTCKMSSPDGVLPMVGGSAIGDAGMPHEFYLLFPYFSQLATDEDLSAMLADSSPVVRIMAAKCVLNRKGTSIPIERVDALLNDKAKVYVAPFGCEIFVQMVADVVAELKRNADFLGVPKAPTKDPESARESIAHPATPKSR